MGKIKVSVIIPAFNEEKRLPATLTKVISYLNEQNYGSEIIVVTDGSKDKTEKVARSFVSSHQRLRVIAFPVNKGKGFAVKCGMLAAEGDYRLFMDADYAVPIGFLDPFLETAMNGAEVVIGSRSHAQTSIACAQGFPRKQLAILFGHLQKSVLSLPFLDTQCGFKLFTADAAEKLFRLISYECAYFDAELLFIAHRMRLKVAEQAVTWTHDQETRLPIGPKRTVDILLKLSRIRSLHGHRTPQPQPAVRARAHAVR